MISQTPRSGYPGHGEMARKVLELAVGVQAEKLVARAPPIPLKVVLESCLWQGRQSMQA